MSVTEQIVPGIHRWTCPHPEYRTKAEQVVSYALVSGDAVALIDPLLPLEDEERRAPLLAALDELVGPAQRLEVMVTIPYHTRSAEVLFERYWGDVATRLWGNTAVAKRLVWDTPLTEIPRVKTGTGVDNRRRPRPCLHDRQPEAPRNAAPLPCPTRRSPSATPWSACPTAALRVWDQADGRAGLVPRSLSPDASASGRTRRARPCW